MFPLIAISAFFILGIAFFAIGKDDFGIKRTKEESHETSSNKDEVMNPDTISNKESIEGNDEVSQDNLQDKEVTANISD